MKEKSINKDFYTVKEIQLKLYFKQSFACLPFSLVITKNKDNSKITLYITIGIIIYLVFFVLWLFIVYQKKYQKMQG